MASNLIDSGRTLLRSLSTTRKDRRTAQYQDKSSQENHETGGEKKIEQIEFDQAVQVLLKGSILLKITVHKKLYSRLFRLDSDYQTLHYQDPKNKRYSYSCQAKVRSIDLLSLKEVRTGYKTDVLNACSKSPSFVVKIPAERCFSLILSNGEAINLIAPSSDLCKCWVNVIQHIIGKSQHENRETRVEKWLKKQFHLADRSKDGLLNFEECMLLLDHLNLHFPREKALSMFMQAGAAAKLPAAVHVLDADGFHAFYSIISERPDLRKIFTKYADNGQESWTTENLQTFLVQAQHEDDKTVEACEFIIKTFEPIEENKRQNFLSLAGLRNYLLNQRQFLFNHKNRQVHHDMTHPLKDYFIASSHNTYLMSNQLTGVSSVEAYIACLLTGCRCVELDCWDGPDDEPIITHGHTLTSNILFSHVIETIREYGFKASKYPVILSIENHCSISQQHVMANHLTSILGNQLYVASFEETTMSLPSPEALKERVIVKGKKHKTVIQAQSSEDDDDLAKSGIDGETLETPSTNDLEEKRDNQEQIKSKISEALSNGVFLKAVKFKSFQHAKESGKFFEMSSLSETKCSEFVKDNRLALLTHCRHQLVRVYPDGLRTDSSNYNPMPMLHAGCQIVALNYQDKQPETQVYKALFKDNGGCGFLLKPEYMRNHTVEELEEFEKQRKAILLKMTIISAQQLPKPDGIDDDDISDPYVTVEIFGSHRDCCKQSTTFVRNNGFNPIWNQELIFSIYEPEIAVLRFEVKDFDKRSSDETIAHYNIPVSCLQKGFRHVELFNKRDVLLEPSTLFVHVAFSDKTSSRVSRKE